MLYWRSLNGFRKIKVGVNALNSTEWDQIPMAHRSRLVSLLGKLALKQLKQIPKEESNHVNSIKTISHDEQRQDSVPPSRPHRDCLHQAIHTSTSRAS